MNWEAIGAVGEVGGAIGVIVTLGYLAVQIRQNSRMMRASALQEIQRDMRGDVVIPLDLAEATTRAYRGEPLTDGERTALGRRIFSFLRSYENIWYHAKTGVLDQRLYEGYLQGARLTMREPLAVQMWDTYKKEGFFHPDFVQALDKFLADHPPMTPVSMAGEEEEAQ